MSITVEGIHFLMIDITSFHEELESVFRMESGIHDQGLLESAVHAPFQTFGGEDLYPDPIDKAARLCFGLAKDHPFRDGNKRTAVHAMLVYLSINLIRIEYEDQDLENAIISIADGSMSCGELADWIRRHTVPWK